MSKPKINFADEIREGVEKEELRTALRQTQIQLAKAKNKRDAVTEAAFEGAHAAMLTVSRKPIIVPKPKSGPGKPETALWHLTDWQGAKLTTSYNTDVMFDRVAEYVKRAAEITKIQRADHPVDDCAIVLGGDMIEGLFNFPSQPYEIDHTLFEQFVNVATLLEKTCRAALSIYKNVTVVSEWGNHGRIGSKRSAVPKSDNADRMTYKLAAAMLADEPRLTWQECPEDIQRLEIGKYRALVIHGDEIGRNGGASPMTIVQAANRWRSGAYRWDFRDIYMGHYHTHAEWSLANGEGVLYQTGSTESDNRYARDNLASSAIPSQRLHFINTDKGYVTAQYKIRLALGEEFDIK